MVSAQSSEVKPSALSVNTFPHALSLYPLRGCQPWTGVCPVCAAESSTRQQLGFSSSSLVIPQHAHDKHQQQRRRLINSKSGAGAGTDMARYTSKWPPRSSADSALGGAGDKRWGLLESSACPGVIFSFSFPTWKAIPSHSYQSICSLSQMTFCYEAFSALKGPPSSSPISCPYLWCLNPTVEGLWDGAESLTETLFTAPGLYCCWSLIEAVPAQGWLREWWDVISIYK